MFFNDFIAQASPLDVHNVLSMEIEGELAGKILAKTLQMDMIIDIIYAQLHALTLLTNSKWLNGLVMYNLYFTTDTDGESILQALGHYGASIKKLADVIQVDYITSGEKWDLSLEDLIFYVINISVLQIEHKAQPTITMEKFKELVGRVKPDCRNAELDKLLYGEFATDDNLGQSVIEIEARIADEQEETRRITEEAALIPRTEQMDSDDEVRDKAAQVPVPTTPRTE